MANSNAEILQKIVEALIAFKADKEYVKELLAAIGDGSPKGVYDTLHDLQVAFPTGTKGIYLVLEDGKWYYFTTEWVEGGIYQPTEVGEGAISPQETSFVDQSVNLFNKNTAQEGYSLNYLTGEVTLNASAWVSDFIPVKSLKTYKRSHGAVLATYNQTKQFITGFVPGTTPINVASAKYV